MCSRSIFLNIIFFKSLFIWKRIFCYYDDNKIDMWYSKTRMFLDHLKKTCSKNQDLIIYTGLALFYRDEIKISVNVQTLMSFSLYMFKKELIIIFSK